VQRVGTSKDYNPRDNILVAMAFETVWHVFEAHFPGRLGISSRQYEKTPETLEAAKKWFPRKAPARVLTTAMKLHSRTETSSLHENEPVHRQLNDAEAMRGLIRILKDAEENFGVVFNPIAEFGQNEANLHPELRVFLHPSDIRPKTKWWQFWKKKHALEPSHAATVLDWVAKKLEAKPLPSKGFTGT